MIEELSTTANKYTFEMNKRTIILTPLPPQQAYADQLKLQSEEEQRKASKKKKESGEIGEERKESEKKREIKKKREPVITLKASLREDKKNYMQRRVK